MPAFISYSSQDQEPYSKLCDALNEAGISLWDPSSLRAGSSLPDKLRDGITQCEVCIFLASRHSLESDWCHAELGAFWGAGKRIFVYLESPEVVNDLPPQLKNYVCATNPVQVANSVKDIGISAAALPQIQGRYHTRDSRHYTVTFEHISTGVYRVLNPDWCGLGYFDGYLYTGFYQYNSTKNEPDPSTWGGIWGLHRAKLNPQNGSLELNGIELGSDGREMKSFSGTWLRVKDGA